MKSSSVGQGPSQNVVPFQPPQGQARTRPFIVERYEDAKTFASYHRNKLCIRAQWLLPALLVVAPREIRAQISEKDTLLDYGCFHVDPFQSFAVARQFGRKLQGILEQRREHVSAGHFDIGHHVLVEVDNGVSERGRGMIGQPGSGIIFISPISPREFPRVATQH